MRKTPSLQSVSTKQKRIAELAREMPGVALKTLAHHIDIAWLKEAYRRTRKDGAPGVDGQTAQEYERNLEENLQALLDRAKSSDTYCAPPVRRVHIPKGDGKTRPIGIPTFEDKVLQRAVVMVLEAIYEQDFLDCSYGFRPGRSAHDAIESLWQGAMRWRGGWLLEADIESFFDSVDRKQLQQTIGQRVGDGVIRRLIGKWLNAGVMEEGRIYRPEAGTPQGGVISPLLANVYLHEVLDVWFEQVVKPRLRGSAHLVRYADDFVILFACEEDARRVEAVLHRRMTKYGLKLHPDKTRLLRFKRPAQNVRPRRRDGNRPGTFDFLGFTHYWGRSRRDRWVVKQKTASKRLSRGLQRIGQWCREHRHEPLAWQQKVLARMIRGHCAYFGITGNMRALSKFRLGVVRLWHKWLSRRSVKAYIPWEQMERRILQRFPLPWPRIVHSRMRHPAKL